MKKIAIFNLLLLLSFTNLYAQASEKASINKALNFWHKAAAEANFDNYFNLMTSDAIFIGTDATENWNVSEFKSFSKPYFDKGKAWDFKSVERNVFLEEGDKIAWFDELLDTHMGICRGSGVMKQVNGEWKVQHYVLSIAIPNDNVDEITKLKAQFDQDLLSELNKN